MEAEFALFLHPARSGGVRILHTCRTCTATTVVLDGNLLTLTIWFASCAKIRFTHFLVATQNNNTTTNKTIIFLDLPAKMPSGTNSQGNHYNTPGGSNSNTGSSYHYSNNNGSYYYSNDNGSKYYSSGSGRSTYTSPSGNTRSSK